MVRDGKTLPTRNFFDSKTVEGKVVASFVAPENGVLCVLELIAKMDGGSLETESSFNMVSFMSQDQQGEAIAMAVCLFVSLAFVMLLSIMQVVAVISAARDGEGWAPLDLLEIAYDVGQVILIMVYGINVIQVILDAEKRSQALVKGLVEVPFVSPDVKFDDKVKQFFAALDGVFEELQLKSDLSTFGFSIMILNLIKVLQTTRAHPRVGVLVATIIKGIDDIIHFTLLFLIVWVTFASTGTWAFGSEREEFATLQNGMTTQFMMLSGEFPEGFDQEPKMIVYVVLSFVVQFLVMLNFMLAIVVDSYAKVKEDIELQTTDSDIFSDVYVSAVNASKGLIHKWPAGLLKKLKSRLVIEAITESHLENGLNMTTGQAKSFVKAYYSNEAIRLNQNVTDVLDEMLEKRTLKMIGWKKFQGLLGSDLQDLQVQERHQGLEQKITSVQEQMAKLQENQTQN